MSVDEKINAIKATFFIINLQDLLPELCLYLRYERNKHLMLLLGIIAHSIRDDWSCVGNRIDIMCEICLQLGKLEWAKSLQEAEDDIICDGRWMRDKWEGPYSRCYWSDVQDVIGEFDMGDINYPDALFLDYMYCAEEIQQIFPHTSAN
jgi:hypothetical protein